ncbi:hypothetical protein [Bacteroides hominis]|uniref:hypothetical protein n=1 Tax=Bacteroides hominis TaxID=2763023 RepID=UPI003D6B3E96
MKVIPLAFIWCVSFVVMAITCMSFNLIFFGAFVVFAADCVYIGKNKERLEREIDEIFPE